MITPDLEFVTTPGHDALECDTDPGPHPRDSELNGDDMDMDGLTCGTNWTTDQRQQSVQVMESSRIEVDQSTEQPDASDPQWKQSDVPSHYNSTSDDPETSSAAARFYAMALNHGLDQVNAKVQERIKSMFPSMFNQPMRNDDFTAVCRNCRAALDIISQELDPYNGLVKICSQPTSTLSTTRDQTFSLCYMTLRNWRDVPTIIMPEWMSSIIMWGVQEIRSHPCLGIQRQSWPFLLDCLALGDPVYHTMLLNVLHLAETRLRAVSASDMADAARLLIARHRFLCRHGLVHVTMFKGRVCEEYVRGVTDEDVLGLIGKP
ncbi:hypothetical protein LA080_010056 [Diaporthe eres]|nr:hypothetical protein LA080_010056 [Diaporthe eres]